MCLGIPGEIFATRDENGLRVGKVKFAGITRQVCLHYVPEATQATSWWCMSDSRSPKSTAKKPSASYRVLEDLGQTAELTDDGIEQKRTVMKYLDEYRDSDVAAALTKKIAQTATRPWVLMEVCGGQTHSIVRYGIDRMIPD